MAASGKKGKKGGKGAAGQVVDGTLLGDFRTEYAKSGAAKCRKYFRNPKTLDLEGQSVNCMLVSAL